jgi:hypothetical protein
LEENVQNFGVVLSYSAEIAPFLKIPPWLVLNLQNLAMAAVPTPKQSLTPEVEKANHKLVFDAKLQELMAKKGKNVMIPTPEKLEEIKRTLKAGKPSKDNPEGKKVFYELDNKYKVVTILQKQHVLIKPPDPSKLRRHKGEKISSQDESSVRFLTLNSIAPVPVNVESLMNFFPIL